MALVATAAPHGEARADVTLTVEPLTWNVIGLDSNDVTAGPDRFLVGARVCNGGDQPAVDATAALVWESQSSFIELVGPSTIELGDIGVGACADAYFLVAVTRDPAAYDATRAFRIDAAADGVAPVSSPTPRELLVERLISQNRNDAISLTGPAEVFVGQTVTYDVTASTATNGYEQLQSFLAFPHGMFSIVSIDQTYTAPPGAVNDRPYADACGWDADPTSPTYLTCVGPERFAGGKAGGDLTTRYVVQVVGTGTTSLTDLIYDFSGSSYHYNADFGSPALTVVARAPIDLELAKTASDPAPKVGEPFTYTLTLTNTSASDATGVEVTDTSPAGLRVNGGATGAGSFEPATGVWSVGDVPGGAEVTLQIDAVAEEAGELTNQAEVTAADQPDADSTPANGDPTEDDHATAIVDPAPLTPPTPPEEPDIPPVTDTTEPEASPPPSDAPGGTDADPGDDADPGETDGDPDRGEPEAAPPQEDELPRTGPSDDPWAVGSAGWLALVTGSLLLVAGHRLDRRQRIRAINVAHAAMLRAQRTGALWSRGDRPR